MIQAFFLSIGQLFDRRVAGVFIKSLALTVLLFGAAAVGIWYGMHRLTDALSAWLGGGQWASDVANIAAIVLILLAHWVLFRVIAIGVIGIFADEVVEAVEAKHYPGAYANARHVPVARSIRMGLGSGLRAILMNLLAAPVYLIALPAAPFVFFAVNAWLLGRDLGDMVAVRHMPAKELGRWRRRTSFRRLMLGAIGTALFLVPGLFLLAPILGAAMAAHAFHVGKRP